MNIIKEATKNCSRENCSISSGVGMSTCMGWTPTFDRNGNRTDMGDPNIHSSSLRCSTCKCEWLVRTQYGETKITQLDLGQAATRGVELQVEPLK